MANVADLRAVIATLVKSVEAAAIKIKSQGEDLAAANTKVADLTAKLAADDAKVASDEADLAAEVSDVTNATVTLDNAVAVSSTPQPSNTVSNT